MYAWTTITVRGRSPWRDAQGKGLRQHAHSHRQHTHSPSVLQKLERAYQGTRTTPADSASLGRSVLLNGIQHPVHQPIDLQGALVQTSVFTKKAIELHQSLALLPHVPEDGCVPNRTFQPNNALNQSRRSLTRCGML